MLHGIKGKVKLTQYSTQKKFLHDSYVGLENNWLMLKGDISVF
jgi:hypothetical protein